MKTVFIIISLPMAIRNLLRTGVLKKVSNEYRVVLLSPFAESLMAGETDIASNLIVRHLPFNENSIMHNIRRILNICIVRRFLRETKIDSLVFAEENLKRTRTVYYYVRSLIDIMNRRGFIESVAKSILNRYWMRMEDYKKLYDEFRPTVVITTHPYLETEWPALEHAQSRGIPLVSLIHSWDNPTKRGELQFQFKKVMVWSDFMKNDIVRFHSWLRPQDVVVTGAPQYDFFFEKKLLESRENFLIRHGLNPDKLLITYAGGGQRFPNDHECLQIILEAIATKKIMKPVQIWVRFYGASDFRHLLPQDLIKNIDIYFEVAPPEYWGKFRIETRWEKGEDDLKNYINMIYHSDIVICSASTVSIDAAVFNKPIVNICFDGYQTNDFFSSVRSSYFTESHYQKVVRSGAIQLAMDPEEMIFYINQALDDPSMGSENRKRLVSEICGRVDGDSSGRMARAIVSAINELST